MPYAKNYPFHPRPDEKDLPSIPVDVPGDEEYLDVLFAPERDKESEETWFHNLKRKWMLDPYAQGLFDYDEKGRNPAGNTTKDTLYHGTGLDNLQLRKSDKKEEENMEKKLAEKDLMRNYDIFEFIKFINEEDDLHLSEVDINKLYHYAMDDRWENELEAWEFAIIIAMWSEGKWETDWEPVMIAMDSKKSAHERTPFYTEEDYKELKSEAKQYDKLEDWLNQALMATWLDVEPLKEIWEKVHGKKDLGTIKTSAQYGELDDMASFLSQKKREEIKTKAQELMYIDDEILEKMGLDDEKYQKLVSARFPLSDPEVSEIRDIYLNYVKEYVTEKVPAVIYLILEDNNYHTFNEALAYLNLFDPSIDDITFYHFEEWEGVNASKKLAQEDNEIYCKTETKKKITEQEADRILQAFNARFDQIEIAGPIYHIYYWIDSDVIKEHWRDIDKAFDGFDYTVKVIQKSSKKLATEYVNVMLQKDYGKESDWDLAKTKKFPLGVITLVFQGEERYPTTWLGEVRVVIEKKERGRIIDEIIEKYPENVFTSSKKLAQDFDTTEGRPTVEHKEPLETEEEIDIDEDFFEGEKPTGLTHTPGQKPLTPSREKEVIEVEKDFLRRLTPMDMKEYTQLTNERTEAEAEGDLSKSDYMDHAIKNLLKKYQEAPSTINESSPASFVGRMMKAHTMLNEGDYTVVISAIQDRLTKLKNDMKLKVVSASVYRIDRESDNKAVVDFSLDMMSRQSLTSRNIVVRAFKEGDEIEILPYFWDSLGRQYHFDEAGIKKVFNFVDTTKHVLDEFKEKEEKTN